LKRVIQQRLENGIAGKILEGSFKDGDTVHVDFTGKSFTFSSTTNAQPSSNAKTL
jgi:ATP-dependent Clp protease ATP-binding subunit ClpA